MSVTTAPAPARLAAVRPPPDARTRVPAEEHGVGTASPGWRRSRRARALIVVVGVLVVTLGVSSLVPQLGAVGDAFRALGRVSLWWLVPLLAISALSFPGAALSLQGASPERLPFRPTIAVNAAAAFTGRLAPSSLGSLSTVALFLNRRGLSGVQAATTVGVDAAAGVVVHLLLLGATAAALGAAPGLPGGIGGSWLAWAALVVGMLAAAAAWLSRWAPSRPRWLAAAVLTVQTSLRAAGCAVRSPRRAALLLCGSLIVSLSHVATLALALVAVGGSTPLLTVAFAYLTASALASVAPTPGGLGAMEAALVGALTLLGTAAAPAVAGVLLYRLLTFWLPMLPGAVALAQLRRRRML